ncbi:MAG: DsbE family thiol:disulfide interchange protein [Devosiaceae bacterium]|nr:DsbE family thiol:disulfide interchange protein [Devosiaceae bacterium MH13]
MSTSEPSDVPEQTGAPRRRISLLALSPFLVVLALGGVFGYQLLFGGQANEVPSALIGQQVPQVSLEPIAGHETPGFTPADFSGQVTLLNVFASWCAPCREEHPMLMRMAQDDRFQIIGINQKDQPADARRFLSTLGNPYDRIGADRSGRASIDWGVYGVPETFIVGADGVIIHKHIGVFDQRVVTETFMPIIERALADAAAG